MKKITSSAEPVKSNQLELRLAGSAVLFRNLVIGVSVLMTVYLLIRLQLDGNLLSATGPAAIVFGGAVAWQVRRQGHLRAAYIIYVWAIWLALTYQAWLRTGMANPALHGYVVIMLLGGWLLGMWHAYMIGVASSVAMLLFALAMTYGDWTPPPQGPPIGYWLALVAVWGTGLLMLRWIVSAHWGQVGEIEKLNQRLSEIIASAEQNNRDLRVSEQRFSTIVAASPVPIAISRIADGCYLDVNPAWQRQTGWTREEAVGTTSVALGYWQVATDRQAWIEQLTRDGRTVEREVRACMKNGTVRDLLVSAEMIDYGRERAVLTTIVDVTERKRIEAELQRLNDVLEVRVAERTAALAKSNDELSTAMATLQRAQDELIHAEKLSSLGRLVAGVAHEMNTPIGNALTAASSLHDFAGDFRRRLETATLKRSQLNEFVCAVTDGADLTVRSLRRAADLLTSFKQVAIDQASERRRRFDLAVVVGEVIDTLRPTLKGLPWEIRSEISAGIVMESYPGPLDQILINLIMNATIHAFAGREHGTVRVVARRYGTDQVELVCEDDGVGIQPDALGRIFDPFFTSRLGQGGSGLGLSITHRLATQLLGGQVHVDSTPGKGSRFILRLPLVAPEVVV